MVRKTTVLKENEIEAYFLWQVALMKGRTFKFKTTTQRVIDGALATRFNVHVAKLLSDFRRAIL